MKYYKKRACDTREQTETVVEREAQNSAHDVVQPSQTKYTSCGLDIASD